MRQNLRLLPFLLFVFSLSRAGCVFAADARIELIVLAEPPFEQVVASDSEAASRKFPTLQQLSAKKNGVIDEAKWVAENGIKAVFLQVPNPFTGSLGELPETVPAKDGNLLCVRAFRDDVYGYVVYGENFSAGTLLTLWTPDFQELKAKFDFSNFRTAPKVIPGDEGFVDQSTGYATVVEEVLYVSHSHPTYAKSSGGKNAFITAIDLKTGKLLWRSAPLVSNASNFVISGDAILSGYGFTNEEDFLFVLNRHTGKTVTKIPVKSGPERIALIGTRLYVRTYNTDYQFQVK